MLNMKTLRTTIAWLTLGLIIFSGCNQALSPTEPTPTISIDPEESQKFTMRAKAELSRQENILPDAIKVISIEFTEFPDASLGVKEPGESYAQVITPGYIIILEHEGKKYEFHANDDRIVRVPK